MRKQKIVIGVAALAFGATLVSGAAMAQQSARPANDGGYLSTPTTPGTSQLYNSAPQDTTATQHYGRPLDDGGAVDQPSASQIPATGRATQSSASTQPQHYGRPENDGGSVQ